MRSRSVTASAFFLFFLSSSQVGVNASAQTASGTPSGVASGATAPQVGSAPAQTSLTNGLPIESTILTYQGLQLSADAAASAILDSSAHPAKIVIASQADVNTMLQLLNVLTQASMIQSRLERTRALIGQYCGPAATRAYNQPPPSPILETAAQISGVGSITSLLQTIGSLAAVNEAVASAPGNPRSDILMELTSGSLLSVAKTKGYGALRIYVPSIAVARFAGMSTQRPNLSRTYLGNALASLEATRAHLLATPVAKNTKACQGLLPQITQITGAVDGFETSLFTGQPYWVSTGQGSQSSSSAQPGPPGGAPATNAGGAPNSGSPSGGASSPGNGPAAGGSASSTSAGSGAAAGGNGGSPAAASGGANPALAIQQLLYADLLLHELAVDENEMDRGAAFLNDVFFLSVTPLEAGGSEMSRQSFLALSGTRTYFSGGAVAQFILYAYDSHIVCEKLVSGYRGYIRADDFMNAVTSTGDQPLNNVTLPGARNLSISPCP